MDEPVLFNIFALAEALHKTAAEIEQITVDEWNYWLSYFKIKRQQEINRSKKLK